jgi:hypothetical protein
MVQAGAVNRGWPSVVLCRAKDADSVGRGSLVNARVDFNLPLLRFGLVWSLIRTIENRD